MSEEKIIAAEVIRDIKAVKQELDEGLASKDYAVLEEKVRNSTAILDDLSKYCQETIGEDRVLKMSLNVFLKDAISKWKKKFWSIDIQGTSDGSVEIECSKIKLIRAFENLILNSMEAGATEVTISVSKDKVVISDDGPGIGPEVSSKIKEEGTTKGKGRGLGLKMVKSFVVQLGWKMELKNNPDEGMSVIFHFA